MENIYYINGVSLYAERYEISNHRDLCFLTFYSKYNTIATILISKIRRDLTSDEIMDFLTVRRAL